MEIEIPIAGKRFTRTIRGSLADAKRELRRLLKTIDDGDHVPPDKRTLAQWADEWLKLIFTKVTARTRERYSELLAGYVLPTLGARRLQALTVSELDRLYRQLGERVSIATVRHTHVVIKSCLSTAVDKGYLRTSPAGRVTLPRAVDPKVGQALDAAQVKNLIAGFKGSTLFPIVATAAMTGARLGELLALRWSDLDVDARTLRIERAIETTSEFGRRLKSPKSKRGVRTIAINAELIELLVAERFKYLRLAAGVPDGVDVDLSLVKLPADALMFPSPPTLTELRNPKSVTKETRKRFRALGFPTLRFHDLRASHGTVLLNAGVPVHVTAARLGHDPAVLLRVYAKRTTQSDSAAADKISDLMTGVL